MRLELGAVNSESRLQGSELPPDSRHAMPRSLRILGQSRSSHARGEEAVQLEWYRTAEWDCGMSIVGAEDGSC